MGYFKPKIFKLLEKVQLNKEGGGTPLTPSGPSKNFRLRNNKRF